MLACVSLSECQLSSGKNGERLERVYSSMILRTVAIAHPFRNERISFAILFCNSNQCHKNVQAWGRGLVPGPPAPFMFLAFKRCLPCVPDCSAVLSFRCGVYKDLWKHHLQCTEEACEVCGPARLQVLILSTIFFGCFMPHMGLKHMGCKHFIM